MQMSNKHWSLNGNDIIGYGIVEKFIQFMIISQMPFAF